MCCCSAVINRYGFNSKGVDAVRANLLSYRRGLLQRPVNKPGGLPGLVGVNLGGALHHLHAASIDPAGLLSSAVFHRDFALFSVDAFKALRARATRGTLYR